jgi:hypothetical protein
MYFGGDPQLLFAMPHAGHAHAAALFVTPRNGSGNHPQHRKPPRERRRLAGLFRFKRSPRAASLAPLPQPVMTRRPVMQVLPDHRSSDLRSTMPGT